MNDPVLNRKLFRHQAQIIHNKIPKYQYGGGIPADPWSLKGLSQSFASQQAAAQAYFKNANKFKLLATALGPGKFGKGIKHAYGTYKAARAASKASGKRGTLWGTLPFTKTGKGPRSAWQVFKKKHPKLAATGQIGTAGYFGKIGYEDIKEGLKKKDYGQVAMGAGFMIPSVGAAAKGIQALRIPGVAGKAAKVSKVVKGKSWKDPRTWGPLSLIGGGALASVMKEDAETATYDINALSEKAIKEIEIILAEIAKDKDPSEVTQEDRNQAVEIWEKQKKDETGTIGEKEMLTDEIVPDSKGSTSGESAEILAKQKEMDAQTQADVLKNKFDNADTATQREFLKFRQSITDLTGTYGNDRDLILMKMASGMMSGTTPHKGLKGFIDVTGKAMGPTVDTALALSNAQKGRDTDLANAFLKMKQEQAKEGDVGLKGDIKTFIVDDDNSPYKKKVVMAEYNDNGQLMQMNQDKAGNITYAPFTYINPEPIKKGANLGKLRTLLSSNAIGLDYIDYILSLPDDVLGWRGYFNLLKSDYVGISEGLKSRTNKYTEGVDIGAYVEGTILNESNLEQGNQGLKSPTNMFTSHAEWIKEEYKNDMKRARAIIEDEYEGKVGTSQLDQLTQVALIETRLKYIVANANKSEDRLTRWDIENAAERTTLLGVLPRPFKEQPMTARGVRSQMRALKQQMSGQFDEVAQRYQFEGGTNNYILKYKHVPYISQFLLEQSAKEQVMNASDMQAILDTPQLNEGGIVGA